MPKISLLVSAEPQGLAAALRLVDGVEEAVPGHGTVLVRGTLPAELPVPLPPGPTTQHAIAVRYDGADLAEPGLPAEEVIRRHSSGTYTVDLLGFAPGFAYLRGLDPDLRRPRRATPRTHVPDLTVAIAEDLSAIYPGGSAGGWHLLGTAVGISLFDRDRALLAPGDTVRFFPTDRVDTTRTASEPPAVRLASTSPGLALVDGVPIGQQHLGVTRNGALDPSAMDRANELVGNPAGTPGLEVVLRGPVLESFRALKVAVVGDGFERVLEGQRLDVGSVSPGLRGWVAVRGGVRELRLDGFDLGAEPVREPAGAADNGLLRLLPGPQPQAYEALLHNSFSVSHHSNRVGLRLDGPTLPEADPAVVQGIAPGMVQLTPDGRAVLFLAGCPATGGYPVAGWVPWEDQPRLAQVRPGEHLTFTPG